MSDKPAPPDAVAGCADPELTAVVWWKTRPIMKQCAMCNGHGYAGEIASTMAGKERLTCRRCHGSGWAKW